MNFYEQRVIQLEKRIKRVNEDNDPRRLKTNKIHYELMLENAKNQLEAWRQKKPFSDGGGALAGTLVRAMGFFPAETSGAAMATKDAIKYLDIARASGLPADNSCDMTIIPWAQIDAGDVPMSNLECVGGCKSCMPDFMLRVFMAQEKDIPSFHLDMSFDQTEENLKYVAAQLGEFIEWAEATIPGIKYNEDKLIKLQEEEEIIRGINYEVYELMKNKPCPIGSGDIGGGGGLAGSGPKFIKYAQARRDEIAERVAKGIGYLTKEKLRMIWTVARPLFLNPYEVLEKWGIQVIWLYGGLTAHAVPIPQPAYMKRKLTPLEKEAHIAISHMYAGTAARWVDGLVWLCRDQKIDAVINYLMPGCTGSLGLKKLVEDELYNELGIPTLQLEGKMFDSNYASKDTITAKLDEFAQMCLSNKNIA